MGERSEFDKLIVFKTPPEPYHPPGSFPGEEMFYLDGSVIPGAYRLMSAWFAGAWREEDTYKPHAHPHPEMLMFLGSDTGNSHELGGEIEFWFEDHKYLLTKSCAIWVPAMVQHAPMFPRRVDDPGKPILFVGFVPSKLEEDINYYSREPKWSRFADPPATERAVWLDELKSSAPGEDALSSV